MRTVLISNIPAPYRVIQFNKLDEILDEQFTVLYSATIEQNRLWNVPEISHSHVFLKKSVLGRTYLNPNLLSKLSSIKPDIIISAGFNLNIIIAYLYSKINKCNFIVLTDSWSQPVSNLSLLHKFVRKIIIKNSDAYICVGNKGQEFLIAYGAKNDSIFKSPLAIDNKYFLRFVKGIRDRKYDIMFSGQFIDRKLPEFIVQIAKRMKDQGLKFKLLLIGSGPRKEEILRSLDHLMIDYHFPGFVQQELLPEYYSNAKILLFPTQGDPWGLVANEACASGTPVLTCENAGAANDLIRNGKNGYILPLDINCWIEKIKLLLNNETTWQQFSKEAISSVKDFSYDRSIKGFIDAIRHIETS